MLDPIALKVTVSLYACARGPSRRWLRWPLSSAVREYAAGQFATVDEPYDSLDDITIKRRGKEIGGGVDGR